MAKASVCLRRPSWLVPHAREPYTDPRMVAAAASEYIRTWVQISPGMWTADWTWRDGGGSFSLGTVPVAGVTVRSLEIRLSHWGLGRRGVLGSPYNRSAGLTTNSLGMAVRRPSRTEARITTRTPRSAPKWLRSVSDANVLESHWTADI